MPFQTQRYVKVSGEVVEYIYEKRHFKKNSIHRRCPNCGEFISKIRTVAGKRTHLGWYCHHCRIVYLFKKKILFIKEDEK